MITDHRRPILARTHPRRRERLGPHEDGRARAIRRGGPCPRLPRWLLLIIILVVSSGPRVLTQAMRVPDDVVSQAGADFPHGIPVNVVTRGGTIRVGTDTALTGFVPGSVRFGSYTSVPMTAAHPFRLFTIDVTATVPPHGLLAVAVRTALPGGPWTPWTDVPTPTHALIQGPTATRWQYRLSLSADRTLDSPQVRQVTVRTTPLPPGYPTTPPPPLQGVSYQVYASREGLIGSVTSNGHRIRPHDHFVALPSDTVLACDGCHDYTVTISYAGRTTTQPVWDVGPWNTANPYWQPPRTPFRELPQGVAAARAAYQKGYQHGRDVFGRPVSNPAGIDLADGVFWDDLHMRGNDWVTVTYHWQSGLPVRARPYAAAWIRDRYQDLPARAITLTTGTRSDQVTVWFKNLGTASWDQHTVLAVYDPRRPTLPPVGSAFCNVFGPDGQPEWASCTPGIPAFVGNGRPAGPGRLVPFAFYLLAPTTVEDTTLYLKLAQQVHGRYQWINEPSGQDSVDALTVHVIPRPVAPTVAPTAPSGALPPPGTLAPSPTPPLRAATMPPATPTP